MASGFTYPRQTFSLAEKTDTITTLLAENEKIRTWHSKLGMLSFM